METEVSRGGNLPAGRQVLKPSGFKKERNFLSDDVRVRLPELTKPKPKLALVVLESFALYCIYNFAKLGW